MMKGMGMNLKHIISENIRYARESLDLSQQELASRIGLSSHSAISDIEAGRRRVSASEIASIANELGHTVDWFFDPESSKKELLSLARSQKDPGLKAVLLEAERLVENYILLKKLLSRK